MITSMTGYGRGESRKKGYSAVVEIRSVNSRFLEVSTRMPRGLSSREQEVKEILRQSILRGSLNVSVKTEKEKSSSGELKVDAPTARAYHRLLTDLGKAVKIKEKVTLEHLLHFSDILQPIEADESDESEWLVVKDALKKAAKSIQDMRSREGKSLEKDLKSRLQTMKQIIDTIESDGNARIPQERVRLRAKVAELVEDPRIIDEKRLELEIAILSEKLDISEECVRFRSHLDVFHEAMKGAEQSGRKLNFLVQEMNREVNTIGSKVNDASVQHRVVSLKEELERVREQLQNVE
jgi:uncharacterized protein (TIGR00255 family)